MSLVLVTSLVIRVAATIWSIVLLRRTRDWRMLFLTAMLALMGVRQGLTMFATSPTMGESAPPLFGQLTELPGLVVSVMALAAVFFLERMLLDQRRAEAERRRFEEILKATPDFVGMADRTGRALYVNAAGRDMAGISAGEDISAWSISDFHPESEGERILREHIPAAIDEGMWSGETTLIRRDGTLLPTSQVIVAHRDDGGNVQYLSTIARDISDVKSTQQAMLLKTQQLTSMTDAMTSYLETGSFRDAAGQLLRIALELTRSEYGFVGLVAEDGALRVLAHEGVRWDEQRGRALYTEAIRSYDEQGHLEFAGLDNLFGRVITEARVIIANDPGTDPRSRGLPEGHPSLHAFLGVPVVREGVTLGMVAVANRPGGYAADDHHRIQTVCRGIGVLLDSTARKLRGRTLESERREAGLALLETERRYERILQDLPDLICRFDADTRITFVNDAYARYFGRTREELMGTSFLSLVPESEHETLRRHLACLDRQTPTRTIEHQAVTGDGEARWQTWTDQALLDEDGRVVEFQSIGRDITQQRRSEDALRESEERYRTLVEHAPEAIVVLDVEAGHFVDANKNAEQLFGRTRDELLRSSPAQLSPPRQPDGRASADAGPAYIREAAAGGTPVFEWTHLDRDAREIPCEVRLVRLPSSTRRLVRGSITDITGRKETEQRQKMMMNELDHRVKNNLAAVIALARHSAGSARSLPEFSEAFSGRIAAMARTHESLARAQWEDIDLKGVAQLTLDAYLRGHEPRVVIEGPPISLLPETAMPLCMALHELATNAAKHGALSDDQGCVHLDWSRTDDGRARVRWRESGGPPVTPPTRGGVGTSLIEGFISYELRGDLNVEYHRDGIRCEMTIPVAS
ncbi:MAG: PAS domain-containing sensor histidine kinase [Planctomycetota bacterium]|jgi:PAS domain S-box-containing protein